MSELVKRQHFVPRTYLKYFCDDRDNPKIHVLPKEATSVAEIFYTGIENIALEKHLYTMPGQTTEQKMAVEKFYSDQLEKHYDLIQEILVDPNKLKVTDEERSLIISTVVTMFYRTSIWVNMQNDLMKRSFAIAFQMAKNVGKDYFIMEDKKYSIKDKTLEEFTKEYNEEQRPMMILTQLEVAMKLIKIRSERDNIVVSKLTDESDFMTSDNPVKATGKNGESTPAPFDPFNTLRLPLDKKHMLLLMPHGSKGNLHTIHRNELVGDLTSIERLSSNYKQVVGSDKFAFGSLKSLEDYLTVKPILEDRSTDYSDINSLNELIAKFKELGLI